MDDGLGLLNFAVNPHLKSPVPPRFLLELEPAYRVFFRNLADLLLFRRSPRVIVTSQPAPFWQDVFVATRTPLWPFLESILWHVFVAAVLWTLAQGWALRTQSVPRLVFNRSDVIYYTPAEYLQPIDTGSAPARVPQKGDPEFARQPIISVPPEADNRTQTIITPPDVRLTHDVPLPNIVAWNSATPAVPLAATTRSQLTVPSVATPVIAPPPDLGQLSDRRSRNGAGETAVEPPPEVIAASSRRPVGAPEPSVIEPPPEVQNTIRKLGEVNIGHAEVVPPAPQLPMGEQRAVSTLAQATMGNAGTQVVPPPPAMQGTSSGGRRGTRELAGAGTQVVPPPPSVSGTTASSGDRRLIALGIHPTAGPPPAEVAGNRRGVFAATPEGRAGAPGTPDITADPSGAGRGGRGSGNGGAG
ncbi:MAG TPA: hypothetical protein VH744_11145, partial [Terriglobales bacterium]